MRYLSLGLVFILLFSCNKVNKYAVTPKISFFQMTVDQMKAGQDTTFFVYIKFEDGDGDIGFGTNNLFFIDKRDTDTVAYEIPAIPDRFEPKRGLSGSLQVEILAAPLILRTDTIHKERDTLVWDIYMKDQAGNMSNMVNSSPLILTK